MFRDFLRCGGGSHDVLFGIPIFGNKHFDKPWFKHTVYLVYRVARKIHNIRLWFRYRFIPNYRLRWKVDTGLKPGWHDCDMILLHACMGILCHYIEWEQDGADSLDKWTAELREPGSEGHGPREVVDRQADNQSEATTIYRWWKVERPADKKRCKELMNKLYGHRRISFKPTAENSQLSEMVFEKFKGDEVGLNKELRALEDKIEEDEQKMLHRLIDIRRTLWT